MKQSASFLYWALFLCISLLGFWACLDIGVGADEEAERATLSINLSAIIGIFSNNPQPYEVLLAHPDRYYGIGFHLPALLISQLFKTVFSCLQISTPVENPIIFSHLSVWMCFLGSTLLVRKLLYRLTESNNYSLIGMLCFLLWPYLLGHGLMNIKDTPFMFAWLLCTLIALPPAQRNHTIDVTNFSFNTGRWIALGLATGWLLSIRISGVLIFIEYFFLLLSFYLYSNHLVAVKNNFIKNISLKNIFIFALVFLFTLLTLYPITWKNPLELIHAITYMSHHPWVGTTLTAGRFIAPTTKLYFYLPTWLLVKLPLIVIIGLLICPWILLRSIKKIGSQIHASPSAAPCLLGLALSVIAIIFALILARVGLYNELRQTLFLFPILFLLGVTCCYWLNQRVALIGLVITTVIFFWDNLVLYPYNYSYLNEIARKRPAIQYFETDYFGFSAGRSARWLNHHTQFSTSGCIFAWPPHLLKYELNKQYYPCLEDSHGNAFNIPNEIPSLLYISQRNLINFPIPTQCKLIHSEERTLPLSKNALIMGRLFACN